MKLARSETMINKTVFMIVSWYHVKDFSSNESWLPTINHLLGRKMNYKYQIEFYEFFIIL